MKLMKKTFAVVATLAHLTAWPGTHAQSALKPGLWEMHTLRSVVDGQDQLPSLRAAQAQMRERLAAVPPKDRKQMEARLGSAEDGPPRVCVSAEMAKNETLIRPPELSGCAEPTFKRSGNRITYQRVCLNGAATIIGETEVSGDQVKTKVLTVATENDGSKRSMETETLLKFVGSNCDGILPLDQGANPPMGQRAGPNPAPKK